MKIESTFACTAHSILEIRVDAVQASAKRFGGYCIWPFSQLKYPVKTLLPFHRYGHHSACEIFSAKWLEEHAKGGSIVNWMTKADGDFIDAEKVRQLMKFFSVVAKMRTGGGWGNLRYSARQYPSKVSETWLRSQGVVRRRQLVGGQPGRRNCAEQIAMQVAQSSGSYKMIGITGASFAHAMALWNDRDVSFFDPNFGEFWFARLQDFVAWLPAFWTIASYDSPTLGLNESYTIQEYAPQNS